MGTKSSQIRTRTEKVLNTIRRVWNKWMRMGKKNLTEEQKREIDEWRSKYSKDELYEIFIQDSEVQSRKDTFWRNIIVGFIILAIFSFLVLKISLEYLTILWIFLLLPFLTFLIVNRTAYSNSKSTLYGKKMNTLPITYYAITFCMFLYSGVFSEYFSTRDYFLRVGAFLYCTLVPHYFLSKIIEKKLYGRKDATNVKRFLSFKMKYDIDLIKDIIKNNIWTIDEIKKFEEHYKRDSGIIFRLNDYLRLSIVSTGKCMSVGVSKESGKYILQDDQTMRIQEKMNFILKEVLNFKKIEGSQSIELEKKHRNLWFNYTDTPSILGEIGEEQKKQIGKLAIMASMLFIGYVLILRMPSELSKEEYYFRIWIVFVTAVLSYLLIPKKTR